MTLALNLWTATMLTLVVGLRAYRWWKER